SAPSARPVSQVATALEILVVYSGILLYIWRWQTAHPRAWVGLLAVVLLSHVVHHDTARKLGLTTVDLRANAETALPLMAALYLALFTYGFARHRLTLVAPGTQTVEWFTSYGVWAAVLGAHRRRLSDRRRRARIAHPQHARRTGIFFLPRTVIGDE